MIYIIFINCIIINLYSIINFNYYIYILRTNKIFEKFSFLLFLINLSFNFFEFFCIFFFRLSKKGIDVFLTNSSTNTTSAKNSDKKIDSNYVIDINNLNNVSSTGVEYDVKGKENTIKNNNKYDTEIADINTKISDTNTKIADDNTEKEGVN